MTVIRIGRLDLVRNDNFQVMVFPENIIDNKMLSVSIGFQSTAGGLSDIYCVSF